MHEVLHEVHMHENGRLLRVLLNVMAFDCTICVYVCMYVCVCVCVQVYMLHGASNKRKE